MIYQRFALAPHYKLFYFDSFKWSESLFLLIYRFNEKSYCWFCEKRTYPGVIQVESAFLIHMCFSLPETCRECHVYRLLHCYLVDVLYPPWASWYYI